MSIVSDSNGQQATVVTVAHGALAQLTTAELANFAEVNAAEVVGIWIDNSRGRTVDKKELVVQIALDWLEAPPTAVPWPDLNIPSRASESYFVVSAHTGIGKRHIEIKNRLYTGLKNKQSTLSEFEIPRFLRELFTNGTRLNRSARLCDWSGWTMLEKMAIAFMTKKSRSLCKKAIQSRIEKILFLDDAIDEEYDAIADTVAMEVDSIIDREDVSFDVNFPVVAHTEDGEPIHHLPLGQENSVLKLNHYDLGPVAYFDDLPIADISAPSALLALPAEMKLMIIRRLFHLGSNILVVMEPKETFSSQSKYNFVVDGPLDEPGCPPDIRKTGEIGPIKNFFALAETNKELYVLALEVFYKKNKFVCTECEPNADETVQTLHRDQWKRTIGAQGRAFLPDDH